MAKPEDGEVVLGGKGPVAGRRKIATAELVRERVDAYAEKDLPPTTEGVMPLNPGFFFLQRMRQANRQ